jgi:hypothetical protein
MRRQFAQPVMSEHLTQCDVRMHQLWTARPTTVNTPEETGWGMASMLKSKIHRATATRADLHYGGSLTVDQDLMDARPVCR